MFNNQENMVEAAAPSMPPPSAYGAYPYGVGNMDLSQAQAMMAATMANTNMMGYWPGAINFNSHYGSYGDMAHGSSAETKAPLTSSSTENSPMTSSSTFNNSTDSAFDSSTGSHYFSPAAMCKNETYNAFAVPGYLPHTVTPNGTVMQGKKKKPVPVPEHLKDDRYKLRRMRNNQSARTSRQGRKKEEEAIKLKRDYLQMENENLKMQMQSSHAEILSLRAQIAALVNKQ